MARVMNLCVIQMADESFMEKEGSKETCWLPSLSHWLNADESKKVLGILYRTMKPLLDDFNPATTCEYDECLKGIPNSQYLEPARKLKAEYGIRLVCSG